MKESCESRVANLLASLDNLPAFEVDKKFAVLIECLQIEKEEIDELEGVN